MRGGRWTHDRASRKVWRELFPELFQEPLSPLKPTWEEQGHTCGRETLDGSDKCPHLSHAHNAEQAKEG
jgi:hypothetical protein